MPDLKGLSSREVMDIFKNRDIEIEVRGNGVVDTYSPIMGTNLQNIKKVKINLKEKS